jgi:hypothetical protein
VGDEDIGTKASSIDPNVTEPVHRETDEKLSKR